ncbi:MAG: hypothetical protein DSY73_06565 [Actinobacteria bacterium]|nr:MAG: hypothetical protein DSY73_06565 [Actinomycetota bacterium]
MVTVAVGVALVVGFAAGCAADGGRSLPDPPGGGVPTTTSSVPTTPSPGVTAGGSPSDRWVSLDAVPVVSMGRLAGDVAGVWEVADGAGPVGTYDLSFPVVEGPGVSPVVADLLRAPVERARAVFVADLAEDESVAVEPSHLYGSGRILLVDTRVVSVEYDLSVEWSGAAGADQRVDTVLIDLVAGRVLEPLDVFYDDSPWLETLASVALADLEARFGADTIWPDGLAATPGNFDHLALDGDGVVLWFDRYQVGPGVLGAPRVTVPWSQVGEFVDPNGPVGHLVAAAG